MSAPSKSSLETATPGSSVREPWADDLLAGGTSALLDAVGGFSSATQAVLLKAVCSWLVSLHSSLSHAAELFLFPLQLGTYIEIK